MLATWTALVWGLVVVLSCVSAPRSGRVDPPAPDDRVVGEGSAAESRTMEVRRIRVGESDAATPAPPGSSGSSGSSGSEASTPDAADAGSPGAGADTPARASVPAPAVPSTLLVGLESDLGSVDLPCCSEPVRLFNADTEYSPDGPSRILPWTEGGDGVQAPSSFFLQVAALKSEEQAAALARRLTNAVALPADSVFDAASDLYKVRVGPMPSRERAEALKPRLADLGYPMSWILRESNRATRSGFEVRVQEGGGNRSVRFEGRHLLIERPSRTVRHDGSRYRGRLLLFINDRGAINVINEIALEDYLRGVVPRELGPDLYPELEALKAQAVAARTYTVRNLGEFSEEGFDICSTPRCQVYGGLDAEHPVSDRAIRETAGEILVDGLGGVVDAMFSASCGGATEDVATVFPLKSASYLRSRPCIENGRRQLVAAASSMPLGARVLAAVGGASVDDGAGDAARFQRDLDLLAQRARLAVRGDRLASLQAEEVHRFLRSRFDLVLDRAFLRANGEPDVAGEGAGPVLSRALLRLEGLPPAEQVAPTLQDEIVLGFAVALGIVAVEPVAFGGLVADGLDLFSPGIAEPSRWSPPEGLYLRSGGQPVPRPTLDLYAGQPLSAVRVGGSLVALMADDGVAIPSRVLAERWVRFRSLGQLRQLVAERYPGFRLASLRAGERGPSGRLRSVILIDAQGRREVVEGLAIRWVLDLPDTWFDVEPGRGRAGDGWVFTGRGRGHGVGLCQTGAYGMAAVGADYRDILLHYYAGAALADSRRAAPILPWQQPSGTAP